MSNWILTLLPLKYSPPNKINWSLSGWDVKVNDDLLDGAGTNSSVIVVFLFSSSANFARIVSISS